MKSVSEVMDELTLIEEQWIDTRRKKRIALGERFIDLMKYVNENGSAEEIKSMNFYIREGLFSGFRDFLAVRIPLQLEKISLHKDLDCVEVLIKIVESSADCVNEQLISNRLMPYEYTRLKKGAVLSYSKLARVLSCHYTLSLSSI